VTGPTIAAAEALVTVGVDTHADTHVAVALDQLGRRIDAHSFATTPAGYTELEQWATNLGTIAAFGVEGTGSWGAGLVRCLRAAQHVVIEVNRPDRSARRRQGKSDTLDAEAAARAVLAGTAQPKTADGDVELIRTLMLTRRSAMKARTQTMNQLGALLVTAPAELREQLRNIPTKQLVNIAAGWRPGAQPSTAIQVTKLAMRSLARRYQQLDEEITVLDQHLARLTEQAAPQLIAVKGLGTQTVAALLVAAGDNPDRMRSESAFAHLCGAAPIPASSGKVQRHRLNRGGDRQATGPSTSSPSPAWPGIPPPAPTSTDAQPTARRRRRSSAASSATSPERSTDF
jgi:transposase